MNANERKFGSCRGGAGLSPGYAAMRLGRGAEDLPARWLLLHGFTGGRGDWSLWPADGPPALAIDLPGHGDSRDPVGPFEDEIRRLLAALPASIDSLCGYSLGGRIALGLLRAAPERFASAVIISAHPGLQSDAERDERRAADGRWVRLLRENGIQGFVAAWERQPLFATQSTLPVEIVARQRATRLAQRPEGLAKSLERSGLAGQPDCRAALGRWPGSLNWIVGALDPKFLDLGREISRVRPATRLHVLDAAGHNPLIESPDALLRLLQEIAAA